MLGKLVLGLIITVFLCQCGRGAPDGAGAPDELAVPPRFGGTAEPILPITPAQGLSPAAVLLGNRLYHDPRLSGSQQISCATCHPVGRAGMVPPGEAPATGSSYYDIPTIFNTGGHFSYFWNGRAQTMEAVILVSLQAENIMDAAWPTIQARLAGDAEYRQLFASAYPDAGLTETTAVDAIATYVQSLTTPNAAFDRWLNGENLTESALAGYRLFSEYGCIRCHQGSGVGGNMYASFEGYIAAKANPHTTDYGRFNITNDEAHRYQFKVPSLRNVAVTAPYFHDGSVATLADAVDAMARHQLGRTLSRGEIAQIVAFLESLTGWHEGELLGGES